MAESDIVFRNGIINYLIRSIIKTIGSSIKNKYPSFIFV